MVGVREGKRVERERQTDRQTGREVPTENWYLNKIKTVVDELSHEQCTILTQRGMSERMGNENWVNMFKTQKRFKRTLFIMTKHNMRILGAIPFIKLQNDTVKP